jgi:hypothetical protein
LLPLARGPGLFAVLPIAFHGLVRNRVASKSGLRERNAEVNGFSGTTGGSVSFELSRGAPPDALSICGLLCAPVLGWGLYLSLMWNWTGNPFEGIQAQKYWGVHSISNLWNLPKFVMGFLTPTTWHEFRGSVLDRCVFVLLLDCLPLLWRLDKELLVWVYMLGVLPAMSGTFTSFIRFASCTFPLFIALGVSLSKRRFRWPRYALLSVFIVLHALLLWRFVNFRWAG